MPQTMLNVRENVTHGHQFFKQYYSIVRITRSYYLIITTANYYLKKLKQNDNKK